MTSDLCFVPAVSRWLVVCGTSLHQVNNHQTILFNDAGLKRMQLKTLTKQQPTN